MTRRAARSTMTRLASPPHGRRGASAVPDATIEPDPGPPPEAVFDRLTGPYVRPVAVAMPGMRGSEDA